MAAWRRRALESFLALRAMLNPPRRARFGAYSPYGLFMDLLPMLWEAYAMADKETVRRIFEFAEWWLKQKSKQLWDPAGVSFYEHLFDSKNRRDWERVIPWLPPWVVRDVWCLWEARLTPAELKELKKMLDARHGLPDAERLRGSRATQ